MILVLKICLEASEVCCYENIVNEMYAIRNIHEILTNNQVICYGPDANKLDRLLEVLPRTTPVYMTADIKF